MNVLYRICFQQFPHGAIVKTNTQLTEVEAARRIDLMLEIDAKDNAKRDKWKRIDWKYWTEQVTPPPVEAGR